MLEPRHHLTSGIIVIPLVTLLVTLVGIFGSAQLNVAMAQDASKYYTVMHPEEFEIDWGAFYEQAEQKTAQTRAKLPHHLDLPYGDDPKQRLDLYLPEAKPADSPVFLFLHGGGFREGDRAQYGFVAGLFAQHDIITAVASYRLTEGRHHYPAQPEDVKNAIQWLYRHVADYGGEPNAIYVGGHSAGAILAADIGVDRSWMEEMGVPAAALRGIVPVSGPYDLRVSGRPGEANAYAPTPELQSEASPVLHVNDAAPAALVALGSLEDRFMQSSRQLVDKLNESGVNARLLVLQGEDHKDTVLSLADADSPLFQMTLTMISDDSAVAASPTQR
jgi:acetyl esterase/lipase